MMNDDDLLRPTLAPPEPGISCQEAFQRILHPCITEIDSQLAVFFGSDDEAGPHKCRVALRRLTTALDAFAPLLSKDLVRDYRREAKDIFRLLGHQRDADVFLAGLPAGRDSQKLRQKTDAARTALRQELRRRKVVGFAPRLRHAITSQDLFRTTPKGVLRRNRPIEIFAQDALARAWKSCANHGEEIDRMGGRDQHEFRKDMKSLRYLAEFFSPLWPLTEQQVFHREMQGLQDALGHLNDLRNARARGHKPTSVAERGAKAALAEAQASWDRLRGLAGWWQVEARAGSEITS